MDYSHLLALRTRLSHEKARYAADPSELRRVWVAGIEKEIAQEEKFLGIEPVDTSMSDDDILSELLS